MTSVFRFCVLPLVLGLPLFAEGCASTEAPPVAVATHPDAVLVDFYAGKHHTASCAGTLIAQNVVLTAAHCADKSTAARVIAPGAGGKMATVSRVHVFDWTPGEKTMDSAKRYDTALLVLRTPIELAHYARLEPKACFGCGVVETSRDPRSKTLADGAKKRTAKTTPVARPLNLFVRDGAGGSGGPVYSTAKGRSDVVVGITVGKGATTGGGYIAPVSNPDVQLWVRSVLRSVSRPGSTAASSSSALNHPQDEDTSDPSASDGTDASGGDYSDPYADPSSDPSADPSSDPGTGDPSSDPGTGDPSSDPGTGDPSSDPGTGDPSSDPGTGDPSSDPGTGDPSSDTPDAPQQTEPVDQAGQAAADPTSAEQSSDSDSNAAPSESDGYNASAKAVVSGGDEQTQCNASNTTCVSFSANDANLAHDDLAAGAALNDKGANYFSSHGSPGVLWANDPSAANAAAADAAANDKPLIVGACYSSAQGPNGTSAIQDLANDNGLDKSQIYGCSGTAATEGDQLLCAGDWKDGNGKFVSRQDREYYGLQSCAVSNMKLNQSTNQYTADYTKCSYDLSGDP